MDKATLRKLAIAILDDGNGINEAAWELLVVQLESHDIGDVYAAVEAVNGRFFLHEGDAETLRNA